MGLWLLRFYVLLGVLSSVSLAQITLDGSLGPRGTLPGPDVTIPAAVGERRDTNLFHSFRDFNVPTGGSATFTGPDGIVHILGRVTGGHPSTIDGRLGSDIANANLFLFNPNGMLFGPHATLDLDGSFSASTADFLRLADGAIFSADLSRDSQLSSAPLTAFGFWGANPAFMVIEESTLEVAEGATLSMIGGDMTITGSTLQAPGGQVHLVSVGSAGEVRPHGAALGIGLDVADFAQLGEMTMSDEAQLNASGDGGGTVVIRSGRFLVDHATIAVDTTGNADGATMGIDIQVAEEMAVTQETAMTADSQGTGNAGDIRVTAGSLSMAENSFIRSKASAQGAPGATVVEVGTLALTGGGRIGHVELSGNPNTDTGAIVGQGGAVHVTATAAVTIIGGGIDELGGDSIPSGLYSQTGESGDAGSIVFSAPTGRMDGGLILTLSGGKGDSGDIVVTADTLTLIGKAWISAFPFEEGDSGDIVVTVDTLTLTGEEARISIDNFGAGAGGRVQVTAAAITLTEGATIGSNTVGAGSGGTVQMVTDTITITEGATITSNTSGGGGAGGMVQLNADTIIIAAGGGIESESAGGGTGDGGRVQLIARAAITLRHGGQIAAGTSGPGNAGAIFISAPTVNMDGGLITAQTESAGGGGDIVVEAGQLILTGNAEIVSDTFGSGAGGGSR